MHSILIIGCGSIGERHVRCFQRTGRCMVTACDMNPVLVSTIKERYAVPTFGSLDEAMAGSRYDAAVICTPANLHLPMAMKLLRRDLDIFIEKPLAIDTALVPETREVIAHTGKHAVVAYVYHSMPWVAGAREFIQSRAIGKVLHTSVSSGQHFPTFRPAYRDIYYARHELGGGTIQDALTHLVNGIEWIVGPCTRVYCDAAHQALEGVTVEDTVTVSARHGDVLASYTMTQFQAPDEHTLLINGELGSVKIELHARRWGVMKHGEAEWTWHATSAMERDDLFISQANSFLDVIEGKDSPLCTFEEAVQTLKFNQAALQSAATGQSVVIE